MAADLRTEVLQAIFPGMDVVATTRHRDDSSKGQWMAYPDTFAGDPIYQVNGAAANEIERCASEDMGKGSFSRSREVRVRTFPWPRTRADLLAVVQYRFIAANPAGACWSIGLLVHLTRRGPRLEAIERTLIAPHHHTMFAGLQLVDVTGDGVAELVVEPDSGGAGTRDSTLLMFELSGRRFRQIVETQSRLEYMADDFYTQVLDVPRSVEQAGRRICFALTQYVRDGKVYSKPRVSQECYPVGTGVDDKEGESLNLLLRPITPAH